MVGSGLPMISGPMHSHDRENIMQDSVFYGEKGLSFILPFGEEE